MANYYKDGIYKIQNKIILEKDGFNIYNPTHEQLIEAGWQLYENPSNDIIISDDEILFNKKKQKISEIENYDTSSEINIFYINDMPIWLDKNTRAGLKLRFEAELAVKQENTSLWYDDMCFTLQLNTAIQMLYALEVYASKCYDNTKMHIANVNKLEDINEIEMYNYKLGYPDILHFSN